MKRWIVRIAVCLVHGAITAIAVAWAIAWSVADAAGNVTEVATAAGGTLIQRETGFGRFSVLVWGESGGGPPRDPAFAAHEATMIPEWSGLRQTDWPNPQQDTFREIRWVEAHGWPFLALWYSGRAKIDPSLPGNNVFVFSTKGGIETILSNHPNSTRRALPATPLFGGFVASIALYGFGWWLVLSVPLFVRYMLRRHRGRCIQCGYDMRGQYAAGCPECGWNRVD